MKFVVFRRNFTDFIESMNYNQELAQRYPERALHKYNCGWTTWTSTSQFYLRVMVDCFISDGFVTTVSVRRRDLMIIVGR